MYTKYITVKNIEASSYKVVPLENNVFVYFEYLKRNVTNE